MKGSPLNYHYYRPAQVGEIHVSKHHFVLLWIRSTPSTPYIENLQPQPRQQMGKAGPNLSPPNRHHRTHTHTPLLRPGPWPLGGEIEEDVYYIFICAMRFHVLLSRHVRIINSSKITRKLRAATRKMQCYLEIRPPSASMTS